MRVSDAEVVDCRIVELLLPLERLTSGWKRRQVLASFRAGAAVVDNQNLVALVIGERPNAFDRILQQPPIVSRRDDDRDQRPVGQLETRCVAARSAP